MTDSRVEILEAALSLALAILDRQEPGDSRAVSDEYVGMAAVLSGSDTSADLAWLKQAQERVEALPPIPYSEITVTTIPAAEFQSCNVFGPRDIEAFLVLNDGTQIRGFYDAESKFLRLEHIIR